MATVTALTKDDLRYSIGQGDFGKIMELTLLGVDNLPVDLSSVSTVKFYLGDPDAPPGTDLIIDGALMVPAADQVVSKGVVRYTWAAADTEVAGRFEGVVKARWASVQRLTYPTDPRITVTIKREIGT